ncbi:hypothetical protein C8J56DRAFT_899039 [Mycena floridula]|nr:hypothetical protein C8J56DRAFT_899039 [Mycena floridula]
MATLWGASLAHHREICRPWKKTQKWLIEQKRPARHSTRPELAKATTELLASIPLRLPKAGFQDTQPVHTLWRFLDKNWLNSTNVDNMLELLELQIQNNPVLADKFIVQSPSITEKLIQLHDNVIDYHSENSWSWMRTIGKRIFVDGKSLISIAHLGKLPAKKDSEKGIDHWVPVIVDGNAMEVRYGDGLSGNKRAEVPPKLFAAYQLWKDQHLTEEFELTTAELPITKQDDGHSCGVVAFNALEHSVDPTNVELVKSSDMGSVRLKVFNAIIRRCLEFGCDDGSSTDDSSSESSRAASETAVPAKNPPMFSEFAAETPFTFGVIKNPDVSTIIDEETHFPCIDRPEKRSMGHSQSPTPTTSPSHKRVRPAPLQPIPAIPFQLPVASSSTVHDSTKSNEVFGMPVTDPETPEGKLTGFWNVETPAERKIRETREFEEAKNEREAKDHRIKEEIHAAKKNKLAENARRQQEWRDRVKEEKLANGWKPYQGKRKHAELLADEPDDINIAEASRPKREFKEAAREKNQNKQGPKRRKTSAPAERVIAVFIINGGTCHFGTFWRRNPKLGLPHGAASGGSPGRTSG